MTMPHPKSGIVCFNGALWRPCAAGVQYFEAAKDGDGGRWITIGATSETDENTGKEERHGGSAVHIDDGGEIDKGAPSLVGKNIGELSSKKPRGGLGDTPNMHRLRAGLSALNGGDEPKESPHVGGGDREFVPKPKTEAKGEQPKGTPGERAKAARGKANAGGEGSNPVIDAKPAGRPIEKVAPPAPTIEPQAPETTHEPAASPDDAGRGGDALRREPVADDGGGGGREPVGTTGQGQGKAKISTIRPEHTAAADPGVLPAELLPHLDPHQVQAAAKAVQAMDAHGGFLNLSGTGAGKTRELLAVAQTYAARGNKILIVAPKSVLKPDFKKGTLTGSYKNDSGAMGLPLLLNDGGGRLAPGQIHVTTYDRFKRMADQVGLDTTLIFDEAHAGKNYTSAVAKTMRDAGSAARNVLYATATPADKPMHVGAYGRAGVFGDRHPFETFKELGMRQVDQRTPNGTVKVWARDPKVSDDEAERRMSGLFDRMTRDGLAIKHEVSMDNTAVENHTVPMPPEAHELMGRIAGNYGDHQRAQSLMAQRLQQEPFKIPRAVDLVKADLAAGRRPIVFAGRVNASTVGGEDGDDEDAIAHSEGTLKTLKAALAAAGITDVSEIHGGVSDKDRERGAAHFQSGKNRVLIGTVNSAGTGINLDDVVGDAPRTLTNMTAPFSANEVVQAAGRINRLTTKSPAVIRNLYADTDVDDWNRAITETKLKTLGAAVGGDVRKLDVDHTPEAQTAPYEWRPLVRTAGPGASDSGEIAVRPVNTRKGTRHVHSFKPDAATDKLLGSPDKPGWLSASEYKGRREATVWGDTPDEVRERVKQLREGKAAAPPETKKEAPKAGDPFIRAGGRTFDNKERLKALGFRWDGNDKVWYRKREGFDESSLPRGATVYSADGGAVFVDGPAPMTFARLLELLRR